MAHQLLCEPSHLLIMQSWLRGERIGKAPNISSSAARPGLGRKAFDKCDRGKGDHDKVEECPYSSKKRKSPEVSGGAVRPATTFEVLKLHGLFPHCEDYHVAELPSGGYCLIHGPFPDFPEDSVKRSRTAGFQTYQNVVVRA